MASGIVHDYISLAGGVLALAGCLYAGLSIDLALILSTSVVIGGVYLSPDLDLPRSRPSRRWGLMSFIWWPLRHYGHRSKLSHGWLIGSLARLAWLFVLASPLFLLGTPPAWILPYLGWATLGLLIGGELHLLIDLLTTGDNDRYG
jgi:uncharacterized metal-binding protein